MAEKPQTKSALLYAMIFAFATASSSPFWLAHAVEFVKPKFKYLICNNSWLNAADYRSCFESLSSKYFPATVVGRLHVKRGEEYSAQWRNIPAGSFCYLSCYALTEKGAEATRMSLNSQPSFYESQSFFTDATGKKKYSITWTWSPSGECNATCP